MLHSLKDLLGYRVSATDGEAGTIDEFYFDDVRWKVRYLVVDTGKWLPGRRVLISPAAVLDASCLDGAVPVSLTCEQIRNSPDIGTHKPVSRQHEQDLAIHYGWPAYWTGNSLAPEAWLPAPPICEELPSRQPPAEPDDPHLRSTREVAGYQIEGRDGPVGRVSSFILDDSTWELRYVVADTGSWLHERAVLLMPESIGAISWDEGRVYVDLTSETIRESPPFYNVFPIPPEYSDALREYYTPEGKSEPSARHRRERPLRVLTSRSETQALYDRISGVYDLLADRTEAPIRNAALEKLAAQPGEAVLEVGFGTGHCLVALARAVGVSGAVYGLDLSVGMIGAARSLLEKEGVAAIATLERGDAVHLPYRDAMIDAVFMSFTLELFDNPEIPVVLGECLRVLKPGGRIVVAGMSKEGKPGVAIQAYEWTHRHFPNFVDCRPILVRRSLEAAGFQIRESTMMHMWVPVEVVLGIKPE